MLLFDGVGGLFMLALWIFCVIDVITTPEEQVRNLPKVVWLIIVILLFDIGSIVWLIAGHNWTAPAGSRRLGGLQQAPRPAKPARASSPDDDEEFLAGLKARVEEQRRRARETDGNAKDGTDTP